jgi:hypothetical protein
MNSSKLEKITQGLPFGYCEGTIYPIFRGKCENPLQERHSRAGEPLL